MSQDVFTAAYGEARTHYEAERWAEAVAIYRQIIARDGAQVTAWALMGLCATQQGDLALAVTSLARAAELEPAAANVHFRLGVVLYRTGRSEEAAAAFRRVRALDPGNLDAAQNLAAALVDLGRHGEARPVFEEILARDPGAELAWAGLANIHAARGETAAMIAALDRALAINPANAATRHLLRAARGETPDRPDAAYVEGFFDDYAGRFETHLVDRLAYDAPRRLVDLVAEVRPSARRVLDLGCGTGLVGAELQARFRPELLVGVDLSGRMVAAASSRGIYSAVTKAEIADFLRRTEQHFDLMTAADVFIYVGALDEVFAAAASRLELAGVLAFTVEPLAGDGFSLRTSGRYAHGRDYILGLGARHGLACVAERAASLRRGAGGEEAGLYLALQRLR